MILTGAAAAAITVAPAAVLMSATDGPTVQNQADPSCYNGVMPWNPYVQSCTVPGPINKIRGSAPDANAIIACRNRPGCLSYYVNNPW